MDRSPACSAIRRYATTSFGSRAPRHTYSTGDAWKLTALPRRGTSAPSTAPTVAAKRERRVNSRIEHPVKRTTDGGR